jgi:hypothetical protein
MANSDLGGGYSSPQSASSFYQNPNAQDYGTQLGGDPFGATGFNPATNAWGGIFKALSSWNPNEQSYYMDNPGAAVSQAFQNAGLDVRSPFFQTYQALAPGMKWLSDLASPGNASGAQLGQYLPSFMNFMQTPGVTGFGPGKVSDLLSRFVGSLSGGAPFGSLGAVTQGMSSPSEFVKALGDILKTSAYAGGYGSDMVNAMSGQTNVLQDLLSGMPLSVLQTQAGISPISAAMDWLKQHHYSGDFLSMIPGFS